MLGEMEKQDPFSRFLRAMSEGRVTELHITGETVIETGGGRRIAQTVKVSVVAGDVRENFDLVTGLCLPSHIVPILGLHMDRVDMLVPKPRTTGQKIVATEDPDAD